MYRHNEQVIAGCASFVAIVLASMMAPYYFYSLF
jgi:hypothetical protein